MPKLKVYRTAAGFHDAYVAAPSMKAALAAWGTDKDLFARGAAELVTDPALSAEPLAHPGTVIRRVRGSAEEQIAALGRVPKSPSPSTARKAPPERRKPPKPDRELLDLAEQASDSLAARQADERAGLAEEEQALARRKRALKHKHAEELAAAKARITRERKAYDAALADWRDG